MKQSTPFAALALMAVALTGCATTGRNYQTDIDALNARVTALQGQLAEKDQEIATLKNATSDQQMAREAAEAALRKAEDERAQLASQLSAQSRKSASTESDLK